MMYHKNGLFFAVNTVIVLWLFVLIAPIPVSAQSDSAARVAIQGPAGEFGDVLLVKDGNDIIVNGLSGAVAGSGKVTISADGMTPITVNASFVGHFPVKSGTPIRVPGGVNLESAQISFVMAGSGKVSEGTIPLNLNGDHILQALRDYTEEVDKVLAGEKNSIDKGMPPHILLDIIAETPADQPLVGKVLLTQRLIIKQSGESISLSMVDQIEGIAGAGLTPPIQSFPAFSRVGIYGVPVDVNNPDITKRVQSIDTTSFADGDFVSNGYFFPFMIPNVNSSNVEEVKKGLMESGIITPQIADVLYLRIDQDLTGGNHKYFLAQIKNDVSAAIQDDWTVITNNQNNAVGVDGLAIIEGTADPFAIVTAYAGNDTGSEWVASDVADGAGKFSIRIPSKANYNEATGLFESYLPRTVVYLGVSDPFGNLGVSLTEVPTDNQLVVTESPIATPQPNGAMIVTGKTEAGALVFVDGHMKNSGDYYFAGVTKADSTGAYVINAAPYFEYKVTIIDQAGNQNISPIIIPGDQTCDDPSNLVARAAFPMIQVTGKVEPNASVVSYGFSGGVIPANPVPTETLPLGAFFLGGSSLEFPETTAKADANGLFSLLVPSSVGQIIYLQAVDPAGNASLYIPLELVDENGLPIGTDLATIQIVSIINKSPGINDIINGLVLDKESGLAIDGSKDPVVVAAFRRMISTSEAIIPFVDQLTELVPLGADGSFRLSIPDRSEDTKEFLTSVIIVVFKVNDDGTIRDIGFLPVSNADGLVRVGPNITFAPMTSDFILREFGSHVSDMMNINRIYPVGSGAGSAELPPSSLPYVFILADGGTEPNDDHIDVNASTTYIVDWKPLNAALAGTPLPLPGVAGLNLGVNYWDPTTQSVVGNSVVFVALIDAFGNFSPNPIPVFLDIYIQDPDASKIAASGTAIFADEGAVESLANVAVYENSNKTGLIATVKAYPNGGFAITDLSISQDYIYIFSTDAAGNESNVVKVKVNSPVQGFQYMVMDEIGIVHTPNTMLGVAGNLARAISKINDTIYTLYADGSIAKISGMGALPLEKELIKVSGGLARDIEVVSANPFKAYVLLGNGVILVYGDLEFFGDMSHQDPSINRLPYEDTSLMFLDLNGNGVRDTEDANENGVLDISVSIGGILETEDTGIEGIEGSAGNGILDAEPILNLQLADQGFGWDIARDLELVKDNDGNVKGYVLLDGLGVLWPFGTDIGAENVRPLATNGYAGYDLFRSLELVVVDGKIVDFLTLSGNGELYALPSDQGGVFGAGPSTDNSIAGLLSADQYGLTLFGFDIARDIEFSPTDTNADGSIDWKDGMYILDGFGGVHAVGGATAIIDQMFLGLDIARDLQF